MDLRDFFSAVFNFSDYGQLLPLVTNSLWAAAILGLVGGLIGTFVLMRDLAFAVHGIAELSFAGAAFALLIGANVVFGSLIGSVAAAVLLAVMLWVSMKWKKLHPIVIICICALAGILAGFLGL